MKPACLVLHGKNCPVYSLSACHKYLFPVEVFCIIHNLQFIPLDCHATQWVLSFQPQIHGSKVWGWNEKYWLKLGLEKFWVEMSCNLSKRLSFGTFFQTCLRKIETDWNSRQNQTEMGEKRNIWKLWIQSTEANIIQQNCICNCTAFIGNVHSFSYICHWNILQEKGWSKNDWRSIF